MAAGERGKSIKVNYLTDVGTKLEIKVPGYLFDNLAELGLGIADGTGEPRPAGLELRRVFFEYDRSTAGSSAVFKRQLPCNVDGNLYQSDTTQEVTVDTRTGRTTGRKGERRTFR